MKIKVSFQVLFKLIITIINKDGRQKKEKPRICMHAMLGKTVYAHGKRKETKIIVVTI